MTTAASTSKTKPKKKLARKGTFVGKNDLVKNSMVLQSGTANIVGRVQVKPGRRIGPDVYFKQHHAQYAPSHYAVASTRLARFLDMPDVIAHNAFAELGKAKAKGVVSQGVAPGAVQLRKGEYNTLKVNPDPSATQAEIDDWVQSSQLVERGGQYFGLSGFTYRWVDLADPAIQKGLADLQLFDAISGQSDRHAGNIFVDPDTGKVTGIDDDQSFGQGQKPADLAKTGEKYRGLPGVVDAERARKILALDPRRLRAELEARKTDSVPLTEKDLDDAEARLRGVQDYLRWLAENDLLVDTWNQESYEAARDNPDRSYLGHYARALEKALVPDPDGYVNHVVGAPPPPPVVVPPPVAPPPVVVPPPVWQAPVPRGAQQNAPRVGIGPQRVARQPVGPVLTLTPVVATTDDAGPPTPTPSTSGRPDLTSPGPTPPGSTGVSRASRSFALSVRWTAPRVLPDDTWSSLDEGPEKDDRSTDE